MERNTRGRGARGSSTDNSERYAGRGGIFETLESSEGSGPQRCEHLVPFTFLFL